MKTIYLQMIQRALLLVGVVGIAAATTAVAQNKAVDFTPGENYSNGYIAGNTLYVAGQQGANVKGADITDQTSSAIAAVKTVVEHAGFQMSDIVSVTIYVTSLKDVPAMNAVYKKLMPDPKPARATVQVEGLIGGAKIEMTAIAVKH
jgi:2-iminobutanoate/2-iminopropanoate deaminase